MRTIRPPDRLANSGSWNCCETVQGIKSPVARWPWRSAAAAAPFEISPSRPSWTAQRISGSSLDLGSTGPRRTYRWWAGASDINSKSSGVFL